MFNNVRVRGSTGLGALVTVAMVIAMYFAAVGVMFASWREGGNTRSDTCAVVCAKAPSVSHNG